MPTLRSSTTTLFATPFSPPDYTPSVGGGSGGGSGSSVVVATPLRRVKTALTRQFDSYVKHAMELEPFSAPGGIKFVGVLDKSLISGKVRRLVRGEFNCSHCNKNAALLMRMVGTNTHTGGFCQRVYSSSTPNQGAIYVALNKFFCEVQSNPSSAEYKFELRVLPHPSYEPKTDSESAHATLRSYVGVTTETDRSHQFFGETFQHYSYSGETCGDEFNDKVYMTQRALDKYTPLINDLLAPLTQNDLRSIRDSLKVLQDDILPSATYASRLNHGVRWFNSILKKMLRKGSPTYAPFREWKIIPAAEKMEIIGNAILGEKIAIDEADGEVTMTAYHQLVGSVWSVLKMDGNRARILRTLEERYCPQKYMRSTAAPSTGKIQNAITTLGDYKCRIHTVLSLVEAQAPILQLSGSPLPDRYPSSGGASGGGSMNAMMELLAENVSRERTSKFGLAKRLHAENRIRREMEKREREVIEHRMEMERRLRINSMTELMDRVRSGEIWHLVVDVTADREVVWFGGFHGGKIADMLCTGNNWGWQYTQEVKVSGRKKVWGIVPIDNVGGFTNWVFLYYADDALSVPRIKQPILWEGILKTEYVKKYGSVFSAVAKKSTLEYPPSCSYNHPAIGCGVTRDTSSRLVKSINVYINGSKTSRLIYYA